MFKQPTQLGGRKPLVQFRAGWMEFKDNLVTPDPRKGLLTLVSDPTGAVEILWTSETNNDSKSFVVFKGQSTVSKITKCTTGRVFLVDISSQRQLFFWLQDKSSDRDEEHLKKMKQALESPAQAASKPQQTSSASSTIQIDALQRILADLGGSASQVNLQEVLGSGAVLEALKEDPAFFMARLHQHLPEGTEPDADIVEQIRNPQVSAAAALLQAALEDQAGFREVAAAFHLQGSGERGANDFLQRIIDEAKKKEKK